ncbi:MAG TPA: FtsX-like permease family protein [Acidimicrobiales bacterium]|nr:FtsX-like permease family protein [Acidimicrobiales bacterium]
MAALIPVALLALIVGLVLLISFDALFRPTIRRLAVRNVTRRRGEAALVVLGSLLGTAIITASFIVGDTLGASTRDIARTDLGPTDEVVRIVGLGRGPEIAESLRTPPIPNVDGLLELVVSGAAVATPDGPDRRAEPVAQVVEVDFDAARAFGNDPGVTGLAAAGATPTGDEVVIGEELADKLDVDRGDSITLFAYGKERSLTIRSVVPHVGIAGFGSPNVFVPLGTVRALAGPAAEPAGGSTAPAGTDDSGAAPPASLVFVSNAGGVFEGAKHTASVAAALRDRVEGSPGVEIRTAKRDLLDDADANAAEFTQIFGGIGAFSVIAGILLLINIFVMLADERKSELGMLRAVGLKRNQLVRAFGMEGGIYSVLSAAAGVIAGIGVGRVIVVVAQSIFNQDDPQFRLQLAFALEPGTLLLGFIVGASISLITVWGASIRLGRLNVIRAIRDIAEAPATGRRRTRSMILGALGIVVGGLMLQSGVSNDAWFGALAGVPIAAFSSVSLLRRLIPLRLAVLAGCGTALFWGIAVFSILPDAMEGTDFPAFVTQGVILVAAAVAIVATNDDLLSGVVNRLGVSNRTLSIRLGFAYPLARVFRTSMLLGMYAIVVFTLTFLSVFSNLFSAQAPKFTREASAGYHVLVNSNASNPVPAGALLAHSDVVAVTSFQRAFPRFTTDFQPKPTNWPLSGFNASFLERSIPALSDRDPAYPDDASAWRAVLGDPTKVVVSDFFLQGGGPPEARLDVGEPLQVINPLTRERRELRVAAVMTGDWLFNGAMVGDAFATTFFGGDAPTSRHLVAIKPGIDADDAAARLEGALLQHGVQASSVASEIERGLGQQESFITLMQGYLALGLIIGIAGLGVVMVRSVRERRRQIGMLRAMGFQSRVVRSTFLVEAGFIAVQGIALGVVLALVTSYQLLTKSETFGDQTIDFAVPWTSITVLFVVALAASLIASATPANQAARIKPAVALRIAD